MGTSPSIIAGVAKTHIDFTGAVLSSPASVALTGLVASVVTDTGAMDTLARLVAQLRRGYYREGEREGGREEGRKKKMHNTRQTSQTLTTKKEEVISCFSDT